MNTDHASLPITTETITMETSSATASPSPLAIARKPVGCATGIGGPLKPIAHGFALFLETLSAVPVAKTDITDITNIIDTITHIEESPDSTITDDDVAAFVELVDDNATTPVSDIPAETVDIVHEDTIIVAEAEAVIDLIATEQVTEETVSLEIDEATLTENATTIETRNIQSQPEADATTEEHAEIIFAEDTACIAEDITAADEAAIDEVVSAITELAQSTEATNDNTFIDTIEITAPTHEQQVSDDDIVDIEAISATQADEETDDETVAPEEDELVAFETAKDMVEDSPLVFENTTTPVLDTTPNGVFVEDSESDVKAVIQDILDTNEGADFETDIEAEVEDDMNTEALASIDETTESDNESDEVPTPLPNPAYTLILEDDFDAAISSIFDAEFENLLDNINAWSVPQVVEKGKSDKELVRERLANKDTAKFNLQNLSLEKAARALTIDSTAPTLDIPKSNASGAEDSTPTSPIEPEHEEVIAATEEETAEPAPVTAIEPEQEEPGVTTTEDKTEELEAFSDNEEDAIELAKDIATRANHSRHSSSSTSNSQQSAEAGPDHELPGSPVTEYSATPQKTRTVDTTVDTQDVARHQATVEDAEEEDDEDSTTD